MDRNQIFHTISKCKVEIGKQGISDPFLRNFLIFEEEALLTLHDGPYGSFWCLSMHCKWLFSLLTECRPKSQCIAMQEEVFSFFDKALEELIDITRHFDFLYVLHFAPTIFTVKMSKRPQWCQDEYRNEDKKSRWCWGWSESKITS